ncbi:peptidase M50 [Mycolicibacterium flavescens]|uniref:Peptidase M50 n=1 Tax=Mycolicibacterium flavescens TaxID=1776 RepID=A0A1E3RNP4_MYCFV|nr:peptidase M50 [Mycolicibacterium flavescens]MCV7278248.1 peptidase M50 [Mycolicibacterium flavescens]ODQ91505.1 peptidase M50 [Mycolicibacterium flavescens]
MSTADVVVLPCGALRIPRPLRGLPTAESADVDCRRLVVVGSDADVAAVLTRLMRTERLGVEVAHVRRPWQARRALSAPASRVPLIRDDSGTAVVGAALWLGEAQLHRGARAAKLTGEAVVDDEVLFDGTVTGVRIEPTSTLPGLRAAVLSPHMRPGRWLAGRAAQLGTTGAFVVRDGQLGTRAVRRSTLYRHTEGWLRVG